MTLWISKVLIFESYPFWTILWYFLNQFQFHILKLIYNNTVIIYSYFPTLILPLWFSLKSRNFFHQFCHQCLYQDRVSFQDLQVQCHIICSTCHQFMECQEMLDSHQAFKDQHLGQVSTFVCCFHRHIRPGFLSNVIRYLKAYAKVCFCHAQPPWESISLNYH